MKYILVVGDGMADEPVATLGGRTPLEAARKPAMDFLAQRGLVGLVKNVPPGFIPGTDVASLSLFGYDPRRYFTGRGPLEAAYVGRRLAPDEVAFRCNLVTVEGDRMKDFSAGHISMEEAKVLIQSVDQQLGGNGQRFYPGVGTGYRHLMIMRDPGTLEAIRCTPPHDIMGQPIHAHRPQGAGADHLWDLMERSAALLTSHEVNRKRVARGQEPANMMWLWGQGRSPHLPTFQERFGLRGAVISAVDLIKGIGVCVGLEILAVPGVTGYFDTNYRGKATYALQALERVDFVFIHIGATDEAGHMGDPQLKVKAIEDIDHQVIAPLLEGLKRLEPFRLLLLPDHATLVSTRTHSAMPVPFVLYASEASAKPSAASAEPRGGVKAYDEREASRTGVLIEHGYQLTEQLLTMN